MRPAERAQDIIIDTDPGMGIPWADIDDNLAILFALANESLRVNHISVVSGNVPARTGLASITTTLDLIRRSVPASLGAERPLVRSYIPGCEHLERIASRGATSLPHKALVTETLDAGGTSRTLDELPRLLESSERPQTLVCLGPLTNIGYLLHQRPDIASRIERLIIMGGAIDVPGNISPFAEFNIWVDPEAARIVFDAPVRKVLVGLDVTTTVDVSEKEIAALFPGSDELSRYLAESSAMWLDVMEALNRRRAFNPHDPIAVSYLIAPQLFTTEPMNVRVDERTGKTVGVHNPEGDTLVCTDVDGDGFKRLLFESLRLLLKHY